MKLHAYKCPTCRTLVFSRARHDYRHCPCGDIAVDGGLDYCRIAFKKEPPKPYEIELDVTEKVLFDDWNQLPHTKDKDKYGWIKPEDPEYPEDAKDNFEF